MINRGPPGCRGGSYFGRGHFPKDPTSGSLSSRARGSSGAVGGGLQIPGRVIMVRPLKAPSDARRVLQQEGWKADQGGIL